MPRQQPAPGKRKYKGPVLPRPQYLPEATGRKPSPDPGNMTEIESEFVIVRVAKLDLSPAIGHNQPVIDHHTGIHYPFLPRVHLVITILIEEQYYHKVFCRPVPEHRRQQALANGKIDRRLL